MSFIGSGFLRRIAGDFTSLFRYFGSGRELVHLGEERRVAQSALDVAHVQIGAGALRESIGADLSQFAAARAAEEALARARAEVDIRRARAEEARVGLAAGTREHKKALASLEGELRALRVAAPAAGDAGPSVEAKSKEVAGARAALTRVEAEGQAALLGAHRALAAATSAVTDAEPDLDHARRELGATVSQTGLTHASLDALRAEVARIQQSIHSVPDRYRAAQVERQVCRRGAIRAGLWSAVGILLVCLLVVGAGRLSSPGETASAKMTPAPLPLSGAKAVDVSPARGIRIVAAANALDRDRTFRQVPIDDAQRAALRREAAAAGALAVGAFDLDSGMGDDEVFPGEITLSLDLDELDVPPALWDHLAIARVDGKGSLVPLPLRLDGNNASITARHNNKFVVMVVLWSVMFGIMRDKDMADMPQGNFAGTWWVPGDLRFCLVYPRAWPHRDESRAAKHRDDAAALMVKHGLDEASLKKLLSWEPRKPSTLEEQLDPFHDLKNMGQDMGEAVDRLVRLTADPEFQALEARMRDKRWLKDVWLPVRVGHVATAVDRAYDYLVDERGFRPPGVATISYSISVYTLDTSLGPETYGECRNLWTTRPFLVMDGTKIPDVDESAATAAVAGGDPTQKTSLDALQTTAVHELFHAVQCAYNLFDMPSYLWFNEATAVALEKEAGAWFVKKGYATTWDDTIRTYDAFARRLDSTDLGIVGVTQHHGYSAAHFIEALRDSYFPGDGPTFLPKLMEDFARVRGGTLASLIRVTSNRTSVFEKDYWLFALRQREDIVKSVLCKSIDLPPDHPFYCWEMPESLPLSAGGVKLKFLPGYSPGALKDAVLVARDSTGRYFPTDMGWRPMTEPWAVVPEDGSVSYKMAKAPPGAFTVILQRIEPYVKTPPVEGAGGGSSSDVFLLSRPPPPRIDLRDGVLTVAIPDTPLMKAPEPPGTGPFLTGYEVIVASKDDPKRKMEALGGVRENGVTTFRLKYNDIQKLINQGAMANVDVTVSYREVANVHPRIQGPPSEPLDAEVPTAAVFPLCGVRLGLPFKYRIGGSNRMAGKVLDAEYTFDEQVDDAVWVGLTLNKAIRAGDGLDDSISITVDRKADKIAKLTIGRKNARQNQSGRVEFTWENIPRRFTVDLGPEGPACYFFVLCGEDARKLNTAAVNEASGTDQEYNPDTGKAETVTFESKLSSVDWPGSFVIVMLCTMTDREIQALVEKDILTREALEKKFEEQMSQFQRLIEKEVKDCQAARQR